ncbi:MAG TPA: DEAD/DEAH box helicase [Candidatus Paceibacterota bacterium]|nr:DEAD/DEAH box helicase [Candidatus Paceibacterota bacterium]
MYTHRFGSKDSGRRSGGRFAGHGRRGPSPRFNSNTHSRGRRVGQHIDVSRFINKAAPQSERAAFAPRHLFTDFAIAPELKRNIAAKGYAQPSPIQDRAIPSVLEGKDVVGIANTGTGKTAAFLIPLIEKTLKHRGEKTLIVVPTRELAIQIEQEFRGFAFDLPLSAVVVVGGAPIGRQISELRRGASFVIGTPGRIKDLMERRSIDLSKFGNLVLDEADRMLDMGFINDVRYMFSKMPEKKQTLFFTATLSKEIEGLISQFLREPVRVQIENTTTPESIDQDVIRVGGADKLSVLHDLLIKPGFDKVLIFGRTKHGVEKLSRLLQQRGFKAESIHGDKTHGKRQKALALFKENHVQVLIATDVAARGLDISGVSHVINYDLPATYEDYVHRIGRTGRGGKRGQALTFIE